MDYRESEKYLDYLDSVAEQDVEGLKEAQLHYGNSWKRRGGVGAFMMLARKWDRLERYLDRSGPERWDIFAAISSDYRSESVLDDVRDLRRYLMLVEAEVRARASSTLTVGGEVTTEQEDKA